MLLLTTGAAAVAGAAVIVASGVSDATVAAAIAQRTRRARAGMGYLLPGRCGKGGRLSRLHPKYRKADTSRYRRFTAGAAPSRSCPHSPAAYPRVRPARQDPKAVARAGKTGA